MQCQNLYLYKPRPKISSYYLLPLANDLFVVFLKTTCTVVRFYRYDIKNERSKRAILAALWPMLSYKRFWMQPCIIPSQLIKLYEKPIYHTLLLTGR